ncbi:GIY-YIG nuclease family protein [Dongia sedimenti]|uniref:GIY-YIG nuclease family protein n=1 Tax=Dongia sedimenti TaxID=3064282 RepID=A0ABU0YX14_9PROT|nr:GIY-YIG nuclease family protein [Rhodospirillaceae bacterium R-7]
MHVYVIAASGFGPSKVGRSAKTEERRRGLQTGHPERLVTYYKVRTRDENESRLVEQLAHRSLRLVRSRANSEWFEVPTAEAIIALRHAATVVAALRDPGTTLDEIGRKAVVSWLKSIEDHRAALDDEGLDSTTLDELQALKVLDVLACSQCPGLCSFSFNDYIDTWPEGPWHRAIRQSRGIGRPSGRSFAQYLDVADISREQGADEGAHVARRWIEFGVARDLTDSECASLQSVWNTFADRYTTIERKDPYIPEHGRDDRVDDVELFAQVNDPDRPSRQCAVFYHEHFRAVLLPQQRIELHSYDRLARSMLRPLSGQVRGFIAPVVRDALWSEPPMSWLHQAPKRRDAALTHFLANPSKRYPEIVDREPVEDGTALALVHNELPRIDLAASW